MQKANMAELKKSLQALKQSSDAQRFKRRERKYKKIIKYISNIFAHFFSVISLLSWFCVDDFDATLMSMIYTDTFFNILLEAVDSLEDLVGTKHQRELNGRRADMGFLLE
jgi:hypothetical protein